MHWVQNRDTNLSLWTQWGLRPDFWPPRHKGGEISSSLGKLFGSSPAWSPEGDQTGAGWFFNSLFSPFPSLFYHPLVPAHCGRG